MLTGKPTIMLDAREVFDTIARVYGVEREAAVAALFGEAPTNGGCIELLNVTARRGDPLTVESFTDGTIDVKYGWNSESVFADLCARGEIAPGDYAVMYWW